MQIEISEFNGLKCLSLQDFTSLEILSEHRDIEALNLRHFPKIVSLNLEPVSQLEQLKYLSLSTIPGWDGSGKTLNIDSFLPLTALKNLKEISIIDVIPLKDGVEPIGKIKSLEKVSLARKFYQLEDYAKLKKLMPQLEGIEPISQMNFRSMCKKCKSFPQLHLDGTKPRVQTYVCPKCNIKSINKHLLRWQDAEGEPSYQEYVNASPEILLQKFGKPEFI
jgi:hypothetical protein